MLCSLLQVDISEIAMHEGDEPNAVVDFTLFRLYVAARGVHQIIYYAGIGSNAKGPRSMVFGLSSPCNIDLAALALAAVFN